MPRPVGIYPMLYAFFAADGSLDRGAMRRQVQACVANGAHGVAVLGLATEVAKLSEPERYQLVEWVSEDLSERLPLAVTVFGETVEQQIALARHAQRCGAAWVILQPPRISGAGDAELVPFFGQVMDQLDMTVAIQNAPEYIGIGLSDDGIDELVRSHDNFTVLKGEGPVLQIRNIIERNGERLAVFNGRAGLELTDNLRAGCAGMIPGLDSFDLQARCFDAMSAGEEEAAEALYAEALPAIVFAMQSIDHLICYGKRIAAHRLEIDAVYDRAPGLSATQFGIDCALRYARRLGRLARVS
ncbi:MAG: dihydrodipicolinate synthase family protein [Betaproteobacteria bacterium]|nr:MAG: dihydrodipicolinate synthase family protein [Betaproteobacteria bacterium]